MSQQGQSQDDLPYRVELWGSERLDVVERVLARAVSVLLGQALFKAAQEEHPKRRITLSDAQRIIADSAPRA